MSQKSHYLVRKFHHNLALPSPTKKIIYKAAWCAHNHCPSSLCRWELSCWSLGAYLGCWKDDIRPVAWMNALWMFADSQNMSKLFKSYYCTWNLFSRPEWVLVSQKKNPAKRENFGRWNQVFLEPGSALEWYHLKRGKSTEDNPEKLQFQLLKTKRFSVSTNICCFSIPFNKIIVDFFWSFETHHFGGTVDWKAPDFDRRTIGSKRAHWWRTQTPGGSSMVARLGDVNCWKIRPRKQFIRTKRVNWSFIRPFPSEWNIFFVRGVFFLWFLVSTDKLLHGHRIDLGRRYNIRIPTMPHRPFQTAYFSKSNSCNQNAFFSTESRISVSLLYAVCRKKQDKISELLAFGGHCYPDPWLASHRRLSLPEQ